MRRLLSAKSLLLSAGLLLTASTGAFAQDTQTDNDWLSRVTIATPLFTHHMPNDNLFNDHNWGVFAFYRFSDEWYVAAGDYTNSYKKNTAFFALSWLPISLDEGWIRMDAGGMLGIDVNGGYRNYNRLDPLLGAFNVKFSGHYTDNPDLQFVNRLGMLVTVIPGVGAGTSTAINLALTLQL